MEKMCQSLFSIQYQGRYVFVFICFPNLVRKRPEQPYFPVTERILSDSDKLERKQASVVLGLKSEMELESHNRKTDKREFVNTNVEDSTATAEISDATEYVTEATKIIETFISDVMGDITDFSKKNISENLEVNPSNENRSGKSDILSDSINTNSSSATKVRHFCNSYSWVMLLSILFLQFKFA